MLVRWLFVALLLFVPSVASATVAGGTQARLLAIGGAQGTLAIVAEVSLQEGCDFKPCEVYYVDLTAADFRRLLPRFVQLPSGVAWEEGSGPLLQGYLAALPASAKRALSHKLQPEEKLLRLTPREGPKLVVQVGKLSVEAQLKELWSAASMNAYDRSVQDGTRYCLDSNKQQAICSSCKTTERWLDGKRIKTWECSAVGSVKPAYWLPDSEAPRSCRCDARSQMYVLTLSDGARTSLGSKALVEPFHTWQDIAGEPGSWFNDTGIRYGTGAPSLTFYTLPSGYVIAVGEAVHLPVGNSTSFPLFARFALQPPTPTAVSTASAAHGSL